MMVPFDQGGGPQQGQPSVAPQPLRPPMPPGHVQPNSSMPGHHQGMNPPPYAHRNSGTMPGQGHYMHPQSPAQRQGSFSGGMPSNGGQYSSHPPLHQGQGPMHGMGHQMHHMNMPHGNTMGMPMQQHDPMARQPSAHQRQPPPPQQQQPPPQQPQQYMNNAPPQAAAASGNSMNGNWQSENDMPHRRDMIQHIMKLLKKDRNSSPESMNRLPQMAKHLEVSLYRNARSFEAYTDMSTLKQRLQQIAVEVSRRAKNNDSSSSPQREGSSRGERSMPYANSGRGGSPFMGRDSSNGPRMHQMGGGSGSAMPNGGDMGYHHGSLSDSRTSSSAGQQPQQQPSQQGGQRPPHGNRNDPEWRTRIRHKQQRLLLLHHSAKCTATGPCRITPHCADMKRLWRHMEGCKDNNCRVPHCFSSRAILSHYRKCKDPHCPACQPVRETVRKSQRNRPSTSRPTSSSFPVDPAMDPSMFGGRGSSSSSHPAPDGSSGNTGQYSSSSSSPPNQYRPGSSTSSRPPDAQYKSEPTANGAASSQQPPPQQDQRPPSRQQANDLAIPSIARPPGSSESEWQKIQHKIQRLLLLRHASKCQYPAGQCPATEHCASMKRLWEHLATCKDQNCKVQHCLSSRYVLSHYRRCKNPRCPSCAPVRDAIRRWGEKEKNQRHSPHPPTSFDNGDSFHTSKIDPMNSMTSQQDGEYDEQPKLKKRRTGDAPSVGSTTLTEKASNVKPEAPKSENRKGPVGDYSLLNSFTLKNLETHLRSLDRKEHLPPAKFKSKCLEVLKGLQTHQHGWVFNCPVDPVELGLPDYFEIVKKPMDLGTIQKKLDAGYYRTFKVFEADVNLTFDNAMSYNEEGSVVYDMAKELKIKFEGDMKKLMSQLEVEDTQRRQNDRACTLCGCEKLLFEPPVYFCNGMNCQSTRIRRNSHFYIGGNNQYFWCSTCFNELDDKIPIELVDMTIMKGDLKKKKNDEVHEESWVQCDSCESWVHQICGMFNTRQNKEHHSEYCCPRCLVAKRKKHGDIPTQKPAGAADLPRTMFSEWLEQHIAKRVERRKRELAEERVRTENLSLESALAEVESGGPIIIRQVTAMDRKHEVRELMQKRYAHKKYPEEFPFRCKCIVVFQRLDGVDVVLFALYVYEHGENNPPPNQRVVYISYLDSVHFMRPRKLRTFVYHEILIAYLDYARRRGFATAHIWACPPLKGDDYIFFAKPEDQKTPRDNRLRQWYIDMLIEAQKRNIVGKVTNMYDVYFANEELDASCVPYLEGDYFPGEAENIIKMLEEGKGKKSGNGGKKKKNKGAKNKGNTGTRSTGVDEEALLASGMISLKDLDRDQVMVKLGETIQPMKESFIVAFLNWSGAKEEHLEVPEEIEKARIEYAAKGDNELIGSKRDALGNVRDLLAQTQQDGEPVKVIDDDAEDLDCEFLNNRQAFLNLCRGNHYQFDELRRSKHTSMMVLWHLHNRDAPKFVQQCVACNREILSGKRYHCNTCQEYDLCQDCYKDPNANRGNCTHSLVAIAVESDSSQERNGKTDAERLQRQRNLMMHIQLIEHAASCVSKTCSSSNCAKMKNYLHHAGICRVKVQGGCKICKRIWTLLRIHAHKCKKPKCPIPQCNAIREKMRQLQKQQQAMDDRRRLEMNRHMRFSMAGGGAN